MILFDQIEAPKSKANFPKREHRWFQYSCDFYYLLPQLKAAYVQHGAPKLIYIKGLGEYNYTLHVDTNKIENSIKIELENLVVGISRFPVGNRLNFFHSLINNRIGGDLFSFFLGYTRSRMAQMNNNEKAALYPPISVASEENEFPPHCDLYPPTILFNIFEDPSRGNDGASVFLTIDTLFNEVLPNLNGFTNKHMQEAEKLLFFETGKDRYKSFYSLLYLRKWSAELRAIINSKVALIKFNKGQGYMLNDRVWMHGRGQTRQIFDAKRLHRLVFNSEHV